jgi:hypothetical protein
MAEPTYITLGGNPEDGGVRVPVYPQRQAYIVNRVAKFYDKIVGLVQQFDGGSFDIEKLDGATVLSALGEKRYDALCTLIPNLRDKYPLWKYLGYSSESAWREGLYDEDADRSPTFPEEFAAFKAAFEANGGEKFVSVLKAVVDPKIIRAELSALMSEAFEAARDRLSTASPNSLGESGGSAPSDSGATPPTSDESAPDAEALGSPSNGSGSPLTTSA